MKDYIKAKDRLKIIRDGIEDDDYIHIKSRRPRSNNYKSLCELVGAICFVALLGLVVIVL